jgi:hypothetical protein
MASWNSFVDYVRRNYKIAKEDRDGLVLVFELDDGRSQMVFLWRQVLMNGTEEWVQIESPCADVDNVSLQQLLKTLGNMVCGGAVIVGNQVHIRNCMLLADMDVAEFERPLQLVVSTADRLEQHFAGGDRY